jgi:hypothetical protein
MAAITMNTAALTHNNIQFLENVTITNQTAASTAVKKGVWVPYWATKAIFTLFVDSMAGTGEALDFVLGVPDWGTQGSITDGTDVASLGNGAWNGITQITAAGPSQVVVEVGPDVTDDDTGSATASCWYSVKAELPPVVTYTYTTADGGNDADYAFRLAVQWKA